MRADLKNAVMKIVELLVQKEYSQIETLTGGQRLTAEELEKAVLDYGRTLTIPPAGMLTLDAIQVAGRATPTWSVRCDLWTVEENRSELSLELTVIDQVDGTIVEVDNLHVL